MKVRGILGMAVVGTALCGAGPLPYDYQRVHRFGVQASGNPSHVTQVDSTDGRYVIPGTGCAFTLYRLAAGQYRGVTQCHGRVMSEEAETAQGNAMKFVAHLPARTSQTLLVTLDTATAATQYSAHIPDGINIAGDALSPQTVSGLWTPYTVSLVNPSGGPNLNISVNPRNDVLTAMVGKWSASVKNHSSVPYVLEYTLPNGITFSIK